jgi:site-specific DNA-methyltransferase (adenine-specific)
VAKKRIERGEKMSLLLGDCVEQMKNLPGNSVDAVVCDPPYDLVSVTKRFGSSNARNTPAMETKEGSVWARKAKGFMGKDWDGTGIAFKKETWEEVLRVTKPGGHLLAFGGTRTYHRMACAIEDAGFEIRDCLQWIYGSGFPKSFNIGKGVAKINGEEIIKGDLKFKGGSQLGLINDDSWIPKDVYEEKVNNEWSGWGSALKPMNEPIVLARKPLSEKSIVENCLKWGVGGLNIDESRIESNRIDTRHGGGKHSKHINQLNENIKGYNLPSGRFPGNVLLDEESARMLDEQSGSGCSRFFYVAKASKSERNEGLEGFVEKNVSHDGRDKFIENPYQRHNNIQRNNHPTVKPVKLMEYLVRLVTPKNGVVLDPFMGSGTTGIACKNLGFNFIGIEKEPEYFEIAKARIENQQTLKELEK